jgi:hypothetical protein
MTRLTLDPTAGRRAREISVHPGALQPILDPTDPRCGASPTGSEDRAEVRRILDPTHPGYGKPSRVA